MRKRAARPARTAPETAADQVALSVWVRLLKAHGLVLRDLRRGLPEGLTLPQFDVLAQLFRRPEGMTHGALSRALLVTAGNLTGVVERLAGEGLVERRTVPEDRRGVRLRLTPAGHRAMRRAVPRHRRQVAQLLSALSTRDLSRLRTLLGRLTQALEGTGEDR